MGYHDFPLEPFQSMHHRNLTFLYGRFNEKSSLLEGASEFIWSVKVLSFLIDRVLTTHHNDQAPWGITSKIQTLCL